MEKNNAMQKWKCNYCGEEFYGLSIVCPSCEFADVEEIEGIQPNTEQHGDKKLN